MIYLLSHTVLDHSGFRIHYTSKLRKEDAGIMISGVSVSDTQLIPPQQKLYRNVGICGPSCTTPVRKMCGLSGTHAGRMKLTFMRIWWHSTLDSATKPNVPNAN